MHKSNNFCVEGEKQDDLGKEGGLPTYAKTEQREVKIANESPDLTVVFMRHGKPTYTKEEYASSEYEGELGLEAKSYVFEQAEKLAKGIKDDEVVHLWVSPKRRAQQTAEIVRDVLVKYGVSLLRPRTENQIKSTIRDVKNVKGFWDKWYLDTEGGKPEKGFDPGKWMERWLEMADGGNLIDQGETPEEVRRRAMRMLAYLIRIAQKVHCIDQKTGKKKRIKLIVIAHEEMVRDILENVYQKGTKKGTGPSYAEMLEMGIYLPENEEEQVRIQTQYGGEKGSMRYDVKDRKIG